MDDHKHTPALVTVIIFCSIAFAKNTKRQKESYASFLWSRFCHSHEKVLDGLGNLGFISKTSSRSISGFASSSPFGRLSLSFPPFIDNQSQFALGNLFLPCLFIVVNGLWEILSTCLLALCESQE